MARFRVSLLAALLLLSAALLAALPGSGGAQTVNHLVISEVMYDPLPPGNDSDLEWVEIHNPTAFAPDDNRLDTHETTPRKIRFLLSRLAPGAFLVVAANESAFRGRYSRFHGNLVGLGSPIGNGLSNTGDRVTLLDAQGNPVDAMSYGNDKTILDLSHLTVREG